MRGGRKVRDGCWQITKIYDNLPTIQILLYTQERLAEYYQKVKGKSYDLVELLDLEVDFKNHCPLCGGADCAIFIGYYHRGVIDENGTYFKEFPIARYLCQGKGKREPEADRTFSLLPYQLVPYTKYSLPFIIKSLRGRYEEGLSIARLQDHLAGFGQDKILPISADQLTDFKQIVIEAVAKITVSGHYQELKEGIFLTGSDGEIVAALIKFASCFECCKTDPGIRGPCGLGYDFYLNEGGFLHNARFLFGTPYQFRGRKRSQKSAPVKGEE
ncbi:MAG: hypothetical protein AB1508_19225 [Pseudomonadota bacterium]